jgi:hypothetical protein
MANVLPRAVAGQGDPDLAIAQALRSNRTKVRADRWPDQIRLCDIEPHFVCQVCGKRGAADRPDFD